MVAMVIILTKARPITLNMFTNAIHTPIDTTNINITEPTHTIGIIGIEQIEIMSIGITVGHTHSIIARIFIGGRNKNAPNWGVLF